MLPYLAERVDADSADLGEIAIDGQGYVIPREARAARMVVREHRPTIAGKQPELFGRELRIPRRPRRTHRN